MAKPLIHFAHANGFPAPSYGELLELLNRDHQVIHKDLLAHDQRFPVTDGWRNSADEIIHFIEATADRPVIGLGHSFGATITLIAASERPELFERIVLMDPVIVVGFLPSRIGRILKRLNLLGKITPAEKSAVRKRNWQSREEAIQYFKAKQLFKDFTEKSIQNYVEHGLVPTETGFQLRFEVPTEVSIYRAVPLDLDRLKSSVVPGLILKGETTDVSRKPFVRRIAKKHGLEIQTITGGHMFPFENPDEVAKHF